MIRQKNGQVKGRKGGRAPMLEQREITEEKKELYRYQARNRAGQNIYNLVHENELSKMWTLTYAENMTDRKKALEDFKNFMKRLNYKINQKIKYVAVIEHQKRGAIHFHMAMEDFYIEKKQFQAIWGKGNVVYSKYKDGRKIENSKSAVAHYMSKYLKKDMKDNPEIAGKKMYLNSKGLERPPKGNGIVDDETFNTMRNSGFGHEIKDRPDIEGFNIPFYKFPVIAESVKI